MQALKYAKGKEEKDHEDGMARKARKVKKEKQIRLAELTAAERDRDREHQVRVRQLELQANQIITSSSASPVHPPSKANSSFNALFGLGEFTLHPYRETVEPIDQYIKGLSRLAEAY